MPTELEIVNSALTKLGAGLIDSAQYNGDQTKEGKLCKERLPHLRKALIRSHPWNFAVKRSKFVSIETTANFNTVNNTVPITALSAALPIGFQILWNGGGNQGTVMTLTAASAAGATSLTGSLVNYSLLEGETATFWLSGSSRLPVEASTVPQHEFDHSIPLPADYLRLMDVYDLDGDYRVESGNIFCNDPDPDILYIFDVSSYDEMEPLFVEALSWALAHEVSYAITQSQGVWEITQAGLRKSLSFAKTADAQEDGRYHVEANLFDESRYGSSIFTDYRNHHRP